MFITLSVQLPVPAKSANVFGVAIASSRREARLRTIGRRQMTDFVCSVCKKKVSPPALVGKPVPALNNNAHKNCKNAKVEAAKIVTVQKAAASTIGAQKGADRKALTGRDHQGNHDRLTKSIVGTGGAKGDRHMSGINKAGTAGSKK